MLWTPKCTFNWQSDNVGSTFTDAGLGTQLTAGGTNHTKNATKTSILSALTYDAYWLCIGLFAGSASTASRRFLTDIYVDPAGGTSWNSAPLIANLAANNSSLTMGGTWYRFPILVKSGSSIGATCQAETASSTQRIVIIAYGQPSHPHIIKVGQFVRTFGAITGTTVGSSVTPGSSGALGSYADFGAYNDDLWWWHTALLLNDTTQTAVGYWLDVAVGPVATKTLVLQGAMHLNVGTTEVAGQPRCGGIGIPHPHLMGAPDGVLRKVFVRAACTGTADSNPSAIVYAVGG